MKKITIIIILIMICVTSVLGVDMDSFEDGDRTTNPHWEVFDSGAISTTGSESVDDSIAFDGTYSYNITTDGAGDGGFFRAWTEDFERVWQQNDEVSTYIYLVANKNVRVTGIFAFLDGATTNYMRMDTNSGILRCGNASTVNNFISTINQNTWYKFSIVWNNTQSHCRLYNSGGTLIEQVDFAGAQVSTNWTNASLQSRDGVATVFSTLFDNVTYHFGIPPPPVVSNFTISAFDSYNSSSLYMNVTVLHNGTTHIFNDSNLINTGLTNYSFLANITIDSYGYDQIEILNYNISSDLNQSMNLTLGRFVFDDNIKTYSGDTISSYTVKMTNSTGSHFSCSATNNDTICFVPKNDDYNISITSTGYALRFVNLTYNDTSIYKNVQNITMYSNNSVYVDIYDASNNSLITWETITVVFSNDIGDTTYTTSNGTLFASNLIDGNYSVRFSGDNYSLRTYQISVANSSYQFLSAYLSSADNTIILRTYDISENVEEGVSCSMERVINSSWTIVESHITDITGRSQFSYTPAIRYRFTCSKSGFTTKIFILDPILFSSYNIIMYQDLAVISTQDYAGITINYFPKEFTSGETNSFTFIISSPDGTLTNYGFNLSVPFNLTQRTGNNAYGETFTISTYFTATSILDTANLTYYYDTTLGPLEVFDMQFNILGDVGNYTFMSNRDKTYGLGFFERTFISELITIVSSGPVFMIAGPLAGGFVAVLILGYLTYIGFMPFWVTIISILIGVVIIMWRSSQ